MPARKTTAPAATEPAVTPPADTDVDGAVGGLREQRRLRRAQMSREHVLAVAEQLFGDQGYQATSLEQVASGSEFSVGAVYKLFASKKDLLTAVLDRRQIAMQQAVDEIHAAELPGLDELLALCAFYLGYFAEHQSFGRLTLRVYTISLESIPDFAEYNDWFKDGNELFVRPIERGQAEGTIRGDDAIWLATLVQGMIIFDNSVRNRPSNREQGTEDLLGLIRRAIAPDPVTRRARSTSR